MTMIDERVVAEPRTLPLPLTYEAGSYSFDPDAAGLVLAALKYQVIMGAVLEIPEFVAAKRERLVLMRPEAEAAMVGLVGLYQQFEGQRLEKDHPRMLRIKSLGVLLWGALEDSLTLEGELRKQNWADEAFDETSVGVMREDDPDAWCQAENVTGWLATIAHRARRRRLGL